MPGLDRGIERLRIPSRELRGHGHAEGLGLMRDHRCVCAPPGVFRPVRVAAGLRTHDVTDEVLVRVTPLRGEAIGAEDGGAGVGGEVVLDVCLGGVHAD